VQWPKGATVDQRQQKRAPVGEKSSSEVHDQGASIQFDGFGPHSVPDVIDGSTYILHAVDSGSGIGFAKGTIEQTSDKLRQMA